MIPSSDIKRAATVLVDSLLVVGAIVAVLAVATRWHWHSSSPPAMKELAVGLRLEVRKTRFDNSAYTLVMALSPQCHYCSANSEFHSRLYEAARSAGVPVVVLVPQSVNPREFGAHHGMPEAAIRPVDLSSLGIPGTPAVLIVDRSSIVRQMWVGALRTVDHDAIVSAVSTGRIDIVELSSAPARMALSVGERFPLADIPFAKRKRTILLAIAPVCRFSVAEMAFHEALQRAAARNGFDTYLLVPDFVPARTFAMLHGLDPAHVRTVNYRALGIPATPTLIIVGRTGRIVQQWIGAISPHLQRRLLESLGTTRFDGTEAAPTRASLSSEGFAKLNSDPTVVVLDVRPPELYAKSHLPSAVNIPYEDLERRVPIEVAGSKKVVVDCTHFISSRCDMVAEFLEEKGIRSVMLLNANSFGSQACRR